MIEREKVLSPSEFVLRDSYESRHLFRRDIAAIDFARVYFLDGANRLRLWHFIYPWQTWVNIGFRALTLASHAIFAARGVLVRYLGMTTIGDGVGGSVRNIWNQCVPRGHIVNRAFRCWRLSTCYCSVFFFSSFLFPFFLLYLSSVNAREIQENPRKIALSLTRKTKVSEKKGMKSARGEIVVYKQTTIFCSLIGVSTFWELYCIIKITKYSLYMYNNCFFGWRDERDNFNCNNYLVILIKKLQKGMKSEKTKEKNLRNYSIWRETELFAYYFYKKVYEKMGVVIIYKPSDEFSIFFC